MPTLSNDTVQRFIKTLLTKPAGGGQKGYRDHIAYKLSVRFGISYAEARRFVQFFFQEIQHTVTEYGEVSLPHLGRLRVRKRASRACRDFATDTSMRSSKQASVRFVFNRAAKMYVQQSRKRKN